MIGFIQTAGLITFGLLLIALVYHLSTARDRDEGRAKERRQAALGLAYLVSGMRSEVIPEPERLRRDFVRWLDSETKPEARHVIEAAIENIDRRERAS